MTLNLTLELATRNEDYSRHVYLYYKHKYIYFIYICTFLYVNQLFSPFPSLPTFFFLRRSVSYSFP